MMTNTTTLDAAFRNVVSAIDAGDVAKLERLVLVALACVACGDTRRPDDTNASPVLAIVDSVTLAEPTTGPLGSPGHFIPLDNGGYLVVDAQNHRLVEYDASGAVNRSMGRKGSGPGEFNRIVTAALDGDSVLYVVEPSIINVLDYRTAEFRNKSRLVAPFVASIAVKQSAVYFRSMDSAGIPRLSVWRQDTIITGPSLPAVSELDAVKEAGVAENARALNESHSWAVFAPLNGDTVAVLSQSSESIRIVTVNGVLDSTGVARTQRQGVRADIMAQLAADITVAARDPQLVYTPSIPTALARTESGTFYSVTTDFAILENRFSGKLFVSVTDENGRTCPDARVPGPEDPIPSVALRGDTLLVLSQDINGTSVETVIRKYLIETDGCKWIVAGAT